MSPSRLDRFPYTVGTLTELAPQVRDALLRELQPDEHIEQITVAPWQELTGIPRDRQRWLGIRSPSMKTPSSILVLTRERLLVAMVSQSGGSPAVVSIPISALLWVELGKILLFSWFECVWAAVDGVQRLWVLFNSVGSPYFEKMRVQLCRVMIRQAGLEAEQGDRNRKALAHLPYKFHNIIDSILLLTDERVDDVIYRPAIWQQKWLFFHRLRAPAVAVLLSNYHLLVFSEDRSAHVSKYAWIARYCSRQRLCEMAVARDETDLRLDIRVGVGDAEESFAVLFPAEMEASLGEWLKCYDRPSARQARAEDGR